MKITILGTGSFITDLNHFSPSYLLEAAGKKILIDAGIGSVIQLLKIGVKIDDLDYIFITHFHADHTANLIDIVFPYKARVKDNPNLKKVIKIFGPKGIKDFVQDSLKLYRHFAFVDMAYGIKVQEINKKTDLQGITVEPFQVEHLGIDAYAYRFEENGKIFVFSGDTIKCGGLEKAVKNADLLITDTSPKSSSGEVHITTTQIGELCSKYKVKKVVLSHLKPVSAAKDFVREVKENFNGEVILAKDLMEIEV